MQVINSLIFNLLASHKSVALPELGTLGIRRSEAFIESSGAIKPPVNHLVFSPKALFGVNIVDAILSELDLKREDVEYAYHKWLEEIKKNARNGNYLIEGVCEIRQLTDGTFRTTPYETLDKLLNPLAVETIPMPKIKKKNRSNKWILWLGIIFVLLWALFALYFFVLAPPSKAELEEEVGFPIKEEVEVYGDSTLTQDTMPLSPADTLRAEDVIQQQINIEAKQPINANFYIIGGAFSSEEKALKFIAEESGVTALDCDIIISSHGLYMVSIKRFADKEDAKRELANFQKKIPSAWIYTKP